MLPVTQAYIWVGCLKAHLAVGLKIPPPGGSICQVTSLLGFSSHLSISQVPLESPRGRNAPLVSSKRTPTSPFLSVYSSLTGHADSGLPSHAPASRLLHPPFLQPEMSLPQMHMSSAQLSSLLVLTQASPWLFRIRMPPTPLSPSSFPFPALFFPLALPVNMLFIYLVYWVSPTKMTAPCNQGCLFALFRAAKSLVQGSHMSGAK